MVWVGRFPRGLKPRVDGVGFTAGLKSRPFKAGDFQGAPCFRGQTAGLYAAPSDEAVWLRSR
jgi:hypothetical protein